MENHIDGTYEYVEVQDTDTYREDAEPGGSTVVVLLSLFLPLAFLGFFVWLAVKQMKQTGGALATAKENTEAIALSNELLRENIDLQREVLLELRKRPDNT